MTCTNCTTRILRSFITDIPTTATTTTTTKTSRRIFNRLTPIRRYTSSSTPRPQSADVTSNTTNNEPKPDFLGMYTHAKKNPNKEALAMWGSSWKTETDLSAMRDHEIRLPEGGNSIIDSNNNEDTTATTVERTRSKSSSSFDFLDDFTSLPPSTKQSNPSKDQTTSNPISRIPLSLKSQFPTRKPDSSSSTANTDEIPWEDADRISKKIATPHNPTANAWKEWSTPALWSHARMQELYKPKTTKNGIRITKYAALAVNAGQLNWNPTARPELSLDKYKAAAGVPINTAKKVYDKDTPEWKIHLDSVKSKIGGKPWNPFSRLSPAAVATLKQLKQENPGMTVEEYAPIFKISPDALRRILKSKWMPKPEEEADRAERWRRRGKSVWQEWEDKGLVETKRSRKEREEMREMAAEKEKREKGFVVRRGLNLKNRIL